MKCVKESSFTDSRSYNVVGSIVSTFIMRSKQSLLAPRDFYGESLAPKYSYEVLRRRYKYFLLLSWVRSWVLMVHVVLTRSYKIK